VVRLTFQPARCRYTFRVTSKTLYSPEYITSKHTQKYSARIFTETRSVEMNILALVTADF
jgi:hypothetical protein